MKTVKKKKVNYSLHTWDLYTKQFPYLLEMWWENLVLVFLVFRGIMQWNPPKM